MDDTLTNEAVVAVPVLQYGIPASVMAMHPIRKPAPVGRLATVHVIRTALPALSVKAQSTVELSVVK